MATSPSGRRRRASGVTIQPGFARSPAFIFVTCNQRRPNNFVMPGLVPGIHALKNYRRCKDVDGRDEPGHDELILNHTV
jgi:hypothetical protein